MYTEDDVKALVANSEKVAGWLERNATAAENRAKDTRFPSLAEANAFDARNYRSTAEDIRKALAPFKKSTK
jgi:hypothetical protein